MAPIPRSERRWPFGRDRVAADLVGDRERNLEDPDPWPGLVFPSRLIWLTSAPEDGEKFYAICVDAGSGKVLHDIELFERAIPKAGLPRNSYATPTPVIEEGRVYLHFGTHGTICLDTSTGAKIWERRDFPCKHHRRPGSSPILYKNVLIVAYDGFDLQYVVGLDKRTGKTIWKRDRDIDYGTDNGDSKKAFATASVIKVGNQAQVVCPSAAATIAYDPETGQEIWRVQHGGMNAASRPIAGHGLVYINAPYGGMNLIAVRPDGKGDVTKSHIAWSCGKRVPKHASQLLVDDLIYMANEPVWAERIDGHHSASPIYAGGRIYFFSEEGHCPVIAPGRTFQPLASSKLSEGFQASPAVVGNAFIFRTLHHLYRVEETAK